jgi:carbon storage regulator CsrA
MLVLSRRLNEKIVFPSIKASVQIVGLKSGHVRLGIDAPTDVVILRQEVQDRASDWGERPESALAPGEARLRRVVELVGTRLNLAARALALLERQLQAGQSDEARATLAELTDDLGSLRDRVATNVCRPLVRSTVRPCKALLVEDDQNERELLASFLRMAGVDVDTAGDGSDALDYLSARGRPDVLLLDMGLPRVDGPSAVRAIRRNPAYAGLKIFAVSGHTPDEYDIVTGPAGIDRWFHKPLDPTILLQDLNQELAASRNRA